MEATEIKEIFDKVFNNMPNPMFCRPIQYLSRGNFLIEVAVTPSYYSIYDSLMRRNKVTPLNILQGLFVDENGCYVTILEKSENGTYHHRVDLSRHIENKFDWQKIIEGEFN